MSVKTRVVELMRRLRRRKEKGSSGADNPAARLAQMLSLGLSGRPASWTENPVEQVRHYRQWVYAAVRAIAHRIAGTELRFYVRDAHRTRPLEDPDHSVVRLFEQVNPCQTRFGLWAETITFLELTGNAYWYVAENGLGVPAEIWVMPSQYMRVVPDKRTFVRGYRCSYGAQEVWFKRHEVVHLKYPNPVSPWYGRGPLQAAASSVDSHEKLKQAEWAAFDQGILSDLSLETDQQLTPAAAERLRTQLQQKFAGPDNAGRPIVLEGGLKAKPISLSPREMAFTQSARVLRDEILAIFGVPAAVAGLSEDVNRSVAEAMDAIFARYCVEPKLRMIEAQINQDLLPRFDRRLICRFAPVVPEDRAHERADMEANLRYGVTTINEERRRQGREPMSWGDRPLMPGNYVPVTTDTPEQEDAVSE